MPRTKRSGLDAAAKNIALLVEKGLAKFPAKERDVRLQRIHEIAAKAGESTRKRSLRHPETLASSLHARPHAGS